MKSTYRFATDFPLCFIFVLFLVNTAVAQKQANIWHFGSGCVLDFSSGAPVNIPGSQMTTSEGCASYCDKAGNFLFYTNGGGREPAFSGQDGGHIWNRNNAVMYDMQGTQGGGFSSAQSAVIFEAPGQDSVYYVFTMDEIEFDVGASPATSASQPGGRGLSYFTVDMRLNGGLGGVVLADQRVYTPSYEGLCAVRNGNKNDYWVLINQDSTGLGVYSVNSSGVTLNNVYTTAGGSGNSTIKASPNGEYVATNFVTIPGVSGAHFVVQFNDVTGQLSNPIALPSQSISYSEFSPNSRYLYTLEQDTNNFQQFIKRYDLQSPNIPSSVAVISALSNPGNTSSYNLQLAPDGNIYFVTLDFGNSTTTISRIKCPNSPNPTVEFNLFTYSISNALFFVGLPNFPAWLFENYDQTFVELGADTLELCGNTQSFTLDAQNPGATYLWSTGATTQTITVNSPGTYSVIVNGACGTGADEVVIASCSPPPFSVNCDTSGNWLFFGNYDGGKLSIIVDQNIPNLKIGITTYEPVDVTFSGAFVNNITDVYYAGFNSFYNNNHCGFPISTSSFSGINPALVTVAVTPPVNIISPPNPNNLLNQPNGWNTGVICVFSCDVNTYQGGCNTIDQVLDVFQRRFGGSLRGLTVQYCCWSDSTPYRVSGVSGSCCISSSGIASIDYPQGILCAGGGQITPLVQGDQSGTFYSTVPGLVIDPATGTIDLTGSTQGTYPIIYSIAANCSVYIYQDTVVIGNANTLAADTVTACDNYIAADGTLLTASGQYTITIPNAAGCDSIIYLTLTITGGSNAQPIIANACNSYTAPWGTAYTQSGIYTDTLTTAGGCDSIVTVDLTITNTVITPAIIASACNSYLSPWGSVYTQSGTFSDTLLTSNGCDSIVSVILTIGNTIVSPVISVTECSSYTAPWGTLYSQSGTYTDTLQTANGCDSIITVNLTITGSVTGPPVTATTCNSYIAPSGEVYTQSGTYVDTLSTVAGCDSFIVLNLTIGSSIIAAPVNASGCDSYTSSWGAVYTQSGTYTDTLTTSNGCDSIITLNLTIGTTIASPTITASACGNYTAPWGTNYSQSGIYYDTLNTAAGCDSINSLNLTVYDEPLLSISTGGLSTFINIGDSIGLTATGANNYQWTPATGLSCTSCPSPVAAPQQTITYVVNATDSNGCSSSTSITITVDTRCNELFIPTIFSPNETGPAANENWCLLSNCIVSVSLAVYDRWGQLIFRTTNPSECWNGKKDGKDVPAGVYAFRALVLQSNGQEIERSGTITLVR